MLKAIGTAKQSGRTAVQNPDQNLTEIWTEIKVWTESGPRSRIWTAEEFPLDAEDCQSVLTKENAGSVDFGLWKLFNVDQELKVWAPMIY